MKDNNTFHQSQLVHLIPYWHDISVDDASKRNGVLFVNKNLN